MKRILLVTKLATSNLGNDALSTELIRAIQRVLPSDTSLEVCDRPYELSVDASLLQLPHLSEVVESAAPCALHCKAIRQYWRRAIVIRYVKTFSMTANACGLSTGNTRA